MFPSEGGSSDLEAIWVGSRLAVAMSGIATSPARISVSPSAVSAVAMGVVELACGVPGITGLVEE
jgi:hypothetical protein